MNADQSDSKLDPQQLIDNANKTYDDMISYLQDKVDQSTPNNKPGLQANQQINLRERVNKVYLEYN